MKKVRYTQVHYIPSHVYTQVHYIQRHVYRTHALSQKERHVHVGKLSFGLWYLVHGIWSEVLTQLLRPRYWSYVVLGHGIERGLNLYKEKKIIRPKGKCASDEYLMKYEIQYAGYGFMMLCLIRTKEAPMRLIKVDGPGS